MSFEFPAINLKQIPAVSPNPDKSRIKKILADVYDITKTDEILPLIEKLPRAAQYFRLLTRESPFYLFYKSARYLAESDDPQASNIIYQMIKHKGDKFEQALGLLILGSRVRAKKALNFDPISLVKSFLNSKDEFLQFYALISLLRMQSVQAEAILRGLAQKYSQSRMSRLINSWLPPDQSIRELPLFLTDWMDPGFFQTSFFRYPEIYAELQNEVQNVNTDDFAIWEIGCSIGLSTESLKIALNESNCDKQLKILGSEINPFVLWYAKRGEYFLNSATLTSVYGGSKQKEKDNLIKYAKDHNWNVDQILVKYFSWKFGQISQQVISLPKREKFPIEFLYDDITSSYSEIPDQSLNVIIYTSVHYELPQKLKNNAIKKIAQKLKSGGKIYVSDPVPETYQEFERYFGKPVKCLGSGNLQIFQKR